MRLSQLFTKTLREVSTDELAINAQLLIRGGFVFKNSAGIYSYLPLGWRVIEKINKIIREEINAIGGQEIFMPALVEKKYMEPTARWDLDVGYKVIEASYFATSFAEASEVKKATKDTQEQIASQFVLGWSHEEVLTVIASKYISSYKDLPFSAYQIQTKFRNEARAKSGLLRGREFMMKDQYSFHADEKDLEIYYEKVKEAYFKIFKRCGLKTYYTLAGGGVFTDKFTHEFQALSEVGEDTILLCSECEYAENIEISKLTEGGPCQRCAGIVHEKKSIEVGNIFNQGTKYSDNLGLSFADENGVKNSVWMGAYGIGISRFLATIVETSNDKNGIIWPESVAPYKVHLIALDQQQTTNDLRQKAEEIYNKLIEQGVEVLFDDREDKTAGEKFADADLIGCPIRLVISKKTLEHSSIEAKKRAENEVKLMAIDKLIGSML